MRIAQLLSTGMTNGAARYCLALSEALAARGHEVILVHRPFLETAAAQAAGVRCVESSFSRTRAELGRLGALMRAERIEVMHSHMSGAHAIGVLLRLLGGPPVAASAHSRHLQIHWPFNDLVIAPSPRTAAYHRRMNLVPARKMTVIEGLLGAQPPNPPSPEGRQHARRLLGLPDEALVVGLVGDVMPEKRQSDLILAMKGVLAKRPEALLVLVGLALHLPEQRRMERAMRGIEDRVLRFTRRPDIPDILPAFDIFAVSSVREEGPLVALEAMAAGLPLVGTRVGRMGDMVVEGETGFLVEPYDVAGLGAGLERLAGDAALRRRMGQAGRDRAATAFSPAITVTRIEAALASVARPVSGVREGAETSRTAAASGQGA